MEWTDSGSGTVEWRHLTISTDTPIALISSPLSIIQRSTQMTPYAALALHGPLTEPPFNLYLPQKGSDHGM